MELKQIKELMALMEKGSIKKLCIKEKSGFELQLEMQEEGGQVPAPAHPVFYHHPVPASMSPTTSPVSSAREAGATGVREEKMEGKCILSPMVGTFYATPSPDDPPFVKVGDRVEEGMVVGIIEAMKVMNEVKATVSGTVAEIFAESAHPVEFGTKLFRVV